MRFLAMTAIATVIGATSATAQTFPELAFPKFEASDFSIEYGISTLGVYVAPSVKVLDKLELRAPIYNFSVNDTFELDDSGNDAEAAFSSESFGLMADYYFYKSMRVSGGFTKGGYSLSASLDNPEFDGTTYTGSVDVLLEQKKDIAPVLALGVQHDFTKNFGMMFEVGARLTSMEVKYENKDLAAADLVDFQAEIDEINEDLKDIGVLPFLTIGVTYRF